MTIIHIPSDMLIVTCCATGFCNVFVGTAMSLLSLVAIVVTLLESIGDTIYYDCCLSSTQVMTRNLLRDGGGRIFIKSVHR